ncbi:MAG: glutamate 5-kinase [Rikenellaceae bacterium]
MKKTYKSVVVKIGSNVLTHANGTLNTTRLSSLVDQIVELQSAGIKVIVVSSGAVAAGRREIALGSRRLDSVSERQLFSAVGQVKLINKYYNLFHDHGVTCGQVLTTKEAFSSRTHYLNQQNCMRTMLENGVIPIINENDTISVTELMFTDNDELSGLVATMMGVDALVILSNIDGIFDGDPSLETSTVIREIDSSNSDISEFISTSKSQYGRGGMLTKSRISSKVADEGIEVIVANGRREGILPALLLGDQDVVATRFTPSQRAVSGVKRWIAHSDGFAKGRVIVDDNALKALLSSSATSLLPVGVVAIEGDFEKHDIVKVVSRDGFTVGVGRIAVDSTEARASVGVRGLKPMIHYDYLYIEEQHQL